MKIAKTTYERLGYQDCPRCFPGEIEEAQVDEAAAFLNADADHAVLYVGRTGFIGIFRGWRGDLNNFYVQAFPLESKDDAKGGDVDALRALNMAEVLDKLLFIEKEASHGRNGNRS